MRTSDWSSDVCSSDLHNGEPIPTDSFLNEEYSCVSALLGCSGLYVADADGEKFFGQPPYYIVHNPMAKNPLPKSWLPNYIEFVVAMNEPGNLNIDRKSKRMHSSP